MAKWGFSTKKASPKVWNSPTLLSDASDTINNNISTVKVLSGTVSKTADLSGGTNKTGSKSAKMMSVWMLDMSKAYHFKLEIEGLDLNQYMKHNKYGKFLPVENISITPVSVESTPLQIGIFADLPIMNKRKLGRLSITMQDTDDNAYEKAVVKWFNSCVSSSEGYVACVSDIIRKVTYTEYNYAGKATAKYSFYAMPDGEVTSSRDYANNDLKKFEFNLIIVSDLTVQ